LKLKAEFLWFWSTVNKNRLASEYERLWDCFNCSLHHLFPILCLACFSNASKSNGSDVEGKGLNSSSISAFPSENKSKLNYQSNPSAFNFKLVYTSFPSCIDSYEVNRYCEFSTYFLYMHFVECFCNVFFPHFKSFYTFILIRFLLT
jgi:hypothetical protein